MNCSDLSTYDIVLVEKNDENKKKYPFLITGFNYGANLLKGYYLTSDIYYKHPVSNLRYIIKDLNDDGIDYAVRYDEAARVPFDNIKSYIYHLDTEDVKRLNEIVELHYDLLFDIVHPGIILIVQNEPVVVNRITNNYYYCFETKLVENKEIYRNQYDTIIYENKMYKVVYKSNRIIKRNKKYSCIGYMEPDFMNSYRKYEENEFEGRVISSDHKVYVVYEEDGSTLHCYRMNTIKNDDRFMNQYNIVRYRGYLYRINYYQTYDFKKYDKYDGFGYISEDSLSKIKAGLNNNYQKRYIFNNIKGNAHNIRLGDVLSYNNKTYVIHNIDNENFYGYDFRCSNDTVYCKENDYSHIYINKRQFRVTYSDSMTFKLYDGSKYEIPFSIEDKYLDEIKENEKKYKIKKKVK